MNISRLDAHHKLYLSLLPALLCLLLTNGRCDLPLQLMLIWIAFAISYIALSVITILTVHPIEMRKLARLQDSSRTLIFIFVLFAALTSLFGVVLLLGSAKDFSGIPLAIHVLSSVIAVICSWAMVHLLFMFRYAHLYYETADHKKSGSKYVEGLDFPEEDKPDFLDFAYFSFVIGMTFQVSDVVINSKRIRHLALMHSLIAFAFNTVIVALSINIISGLTAK